MHCGRLGTDALRSGGYVGRSESGRIVSRNGQERRNLAIDQIALARIAQVANSSDSRPNRRNLLGRKDLCRTDLPMSQNRPDNSFNIEAFSTGGC